MLTVGRGGEGRLGTGNTGDSLKPMLIQGGINGLGVHSASASASHTLVAAGIPLRVSLILSQVSVNV